MNSTTTNKQQAISIPAEHTPKFLIALIALAICQVVNVLFILLLLLTNGSLARKERVYIQSPNGTSQAAIQVDPLHREPEVLKTTAESFLHFFFEWSAQLPNGEKDKGVDAYGVSVPAKVYMGSYLLDARLRPEMLKLMGSDVIPTEVLNGSLESTVIIHEISEPLEIAPGQWRVRVVAVRIERNSKGELSEVVFNRRIDLKAIRPQKSTLTPADQESPFSESVRHLLQNGVVITNMTEG